MILHNSHSSKACDIELQENWNVQTIQLMENAGMAVALEINNDQQFHKSQAIFIFCGPGNNGGDGFVVGRVLFTLGYSVHVYVLADPSSYKDAAKENLEIILRLSNNNSHFIIAHHPEIQQIRDDFQLYGPEVLVDAIFGVGLHSGITSYYGDLIQLINETNKVVYAIDIPSGIHADTGCIMNHSIKATKTITFTTPKIGHFIYPGRENSGKLLIKPIGVPDVLNKKHEKAFTFSKAQDLKNYLPERPKDSHKGLFGSVFVVGGSSNYQGALSMCVKASYLAGSGKVFAVYPHHLAQIFTSLAPECIHLPLSEAYPNKMSDVLMQFLSEQGLKNSVLCIGPGLGRDELSQDLVKQIFLTWQGTLLMDADGLYAIRNLIHEFSHPGKLILTPHIGEMAYLTGNSIENIKQDLLNFASRYAEAWKCTLVLKTASTIVASPEFPPYINTFGNPGMATAGSGDILAGIISGLVAQKMDFHHAAILGVSLHSIAGDLASIEKTCWSLCASDILSQIPSAFKEIVQ